MSETIKECTFVDHPWGGQPKSCERGKPPRPAPPPSLSYPINFIPFYMISLVSLELVYACGKLCCAVRVCVCLFEISSLN